MALSQEKIAQLLQEELDKPKGGRRPKGGIDTTIRDYQTWYKLNHKLFDENGPDGKAVCSNPECSDTREGAKLVVVIGDKNMCRICFMAGYGLNHSNAVSGDTSGNPG